MKIYKLNLLAICTAVMLLMACKKDDTNLEVLPEGSVAFDFPTEVVVMNNVNIKAPSLLSVEMKAKLLGDVSSDQHYVTFVADTTKITEYRAKYGSSALLLPTSSYLYYKPIVAIAAGTKVSEPGVLNFGIQTSLRGRSSYVLPLAIASIDGQPQDPKTRKVVYYVFNTGDALYVDHTGFTLTATASSVQGVNAAANAIDANLLGTYWFSSIAQSLPQWINIDYKREVTFSGIDYFFPTAQNYTTSGGAPSSVKLETSSDNIVWVDKGTYAVDIKNTDRKQSLNLPSLTTARYLRVTVLAAAPFVSGGISYSAAFVSGILLRN